MIVPPLGQAPQPDTGAADGDILEKLGIRAAAAGVPDAHTDASLLRLCAEFLCVDAETIVSEAQIANAVTEAEGDRLLNICDSTLWPQHGKLVEQIICAHAQTGEGVMAKANALRSVLAAEMRQFAREEPDVFEPSHRLTWSLVQDIAATGRIGEVHEVNAAAPPAAASRSAAGVTLAPIRAATEALAAATCLLLDRSRATVARSQFLLAASRPGSRPFSHASSC